MNREQLAHFVRGAAPITVDGDIVIIGSQSILGAADVGHLPEEATMSMEADVAFRDDIDASKADAVDGAIGELSQLHETYGHYAQGWEQATGPESSTAPSDSAEALRCEDLALLAVNSSRVSSPRSRMFSSRANSLTGSDAGGGCSIGLGDFGLISAATALSGRSCFRFFLPNSPMCRP